MGVLGLYFEFWIYFPFGCLVWNVECFLHLHLSLCLNMSKQLGFIKNLCWAKIKNFLSMSSHNSCGGFPLPPWHQCHSRSKLLRRVVFPPNVTKKKLFICEGSVSIIVWGRYLFSCRVIDSNLKICAIDLSSKIWVMWI